MLVNVLKGHKVCRVRGECKVYKAFKVIKGHKAFKVIRVRKVTQVIKVRKVPKACKEPRSLDLLEHR